ncbi:MAG: glyoxylate/hydroxypyruvate reductase A [Proteobacteria bacterium]|nr:glyoxylate/hydroxypyruvate reductase A [Pseudomonadota bacterium]MBI3496453.1 glyoxylate/hydroxypyruvate reductase A [Pseudomonadota bacterium]
MAMLFKSGAGRTEWWRNELTRLEPGLDFRVWPEIGDPTEIEFALGWEFPPGSLHRFSNLKCLCSIGAGVDHVFRDPNLPPNLPIVRIVDPWMTNAMSEFVALNVLRFHRYDPEYRRLQTDGIWGEEVPSPDSTTRRVGIMGLGVLGQDAAAKLIPFGFPIAGWSRRPKTVPGVESFSGAAGLDALLARTDILVMLLPLTPETTGLLDRRRLALMPKGAAIVNAARGAMIVEADLLAALESGHIAGAALDVFAQEPPPKDHAFWRHPKVVLTPHIAAITNPSTASPQIIDNYRRARAGQPLLNRVDPSVGY